MDFEPFELQHTAKIRVKYADTDQMGHVYNGRYFEYFEVGRTELMRHNGLPYTVFESRDYLLPLVETGARFISPAFYDDMLEVEARVMVERRPLVRFEYNIFRGDSTIAKGYTVHSFMKRDSRKPVKPPQFYFDAVSEFNKSKQGEKP
ncbi:MAG: acyl-CoA thioesterase [Candidatus Kapaibacterium sp.]